MSERDVTTLSVEELREQFDHFVNHAVACDVFTLFKHEPRCTCGADKTVAAVHELCRRALAAERGSDAELLDWLQSEMHRLLKADPLQRGSRCMLSATEFRLAGGDVRKALAAARIRALASETK